MKQICLSTIFAIWLVAAAIMCPLTRAQGNKAQPEPLQLKVGDAAPDFKLLDYDGKDVTLSQYRGKSNVVLAFYIFAFTGG
jgi:cytochrome oxidase Cu insertion factor (SCO1/SenC/PrrC family)